MGNICLSNQPKITLSHHFTSKKQSFLAQKITQGKKPIFRKKNQNGAIIIFEKHKRYVQKLQKKQQLLNDTRKKVEKMEEYPYCAIGHLLMEFSNSKDNGTGSLIGPNLVLTCAHNLYNKEQQKQVEKVWFTPARKGVQGRVYVAVKWFFPLEFIEATNLEEAEQWDFALIKLKSEEDLSLQYGYFGINTGWNCTSKQSMIRIYGYPDHSQQQFKFQYGDSCPASQVILTNSQIKHHIITSAGQSGSPIFIQDSSKEFQVIGIHTNGNDQFNLGVLLNEKIRERLNGWIEIMKGLLDLAGLDIGDDGMKQIVNRQHDLTCITELKLSNNLISWKGIALLIEIELPALKVLDLANNNLKVEGARLLASREWHQIQQLNVSNTEIEEEGVILLMDRHWDHLTKLFLNYCSIGERGINAIMKKQWPLMTSLHLMKNKMNEQCIIELCSYEWPKIKDLNLSENELTDKSIQYLIQKQTILEIQSLNLKNTKMSEAGMAALSSKRWKCLKKLKIQDNKHVGYKGISYLSSDCLPNVTVLNLSSLSISKEGLKHLIRSTWHYLKTLQLGFNYIGDEGIGIFINQSFPTIESLNLQGNNLSEVSLHRLKQNGDWLTLKKLKIRSNKINRKGFQILLTALNSLTFIDLINNDLNTYEKRLIEEQFAKIKPNVELLIDFDQ